MTNPEAPLSPEDRQAVTETCTNFAWCIDERRWSDLEALFTPTVDVDYSDLFGGQPMTVRASDLAGHSRRSLGCLTATQHLVASHLVTGAGNQARCRSQVIASHVWLGTRTGDSNWTVGGCYQMDLQRSEGGWRISRVSFTVAWSSGNQAILQEAGAASRS